MLLNEKELAILRQFGGDYSKQVYGRQIAEKLKFNQKTVSNIVKLVQKILIVVSLFLLYFIGFGIIRICLLFRPGYFKQKNKILNYDLNINNAFRQS